MAKKLSSVTDILDALEDLANSEDNVSVGDVTQSLGGRGFGPLILLPALLTISPLGGVPTVPTIMALIVAIFAAQIVMQRDTFWLPGFLRHRSVDDDKITNATRKLRGLANWLDEYVGEMLPSLVHPPMPSVAGGVVMGLCLLVPPSEMLPFAAILPMGAVALIGLALTLRNGVVMLIGLIGSAAALYGVWRLVI